MPVLPRLDLTRLTQSHLPVRTRFAPSPTGYLHLGHVVNAIYVWGVAHAVGGEVLLRIEDHDRLRSRAYFERAILEDLAWLGFVPDAGLDPPLRQSDDPSAYAAALEHLEHHHLAFRCDCSRQAVKRRGERYDGHCRSRGLEEGSGRGVRVRVEPGDESFDDLRLGPIAQEPSDQCGDFLLRDRDGHWTYQHAVTVDDARQDITLVVRGEDLLSSTGRQLRLARMLGRTEMPLFLHHPLLLAPGGEKLSKSDGATGIRELRAAGLSAAAVIGRAAAAAGLIAAPADVTALEVPALFR